MRNWEKSRQRRRIPLRGKKEESGEGDKRMERVSSGNVAQNESKNAQTESLEHTA